MREELRAPPLLWDGADHAGPTILLAHGAGAGSDHEFQVDVAARLAAEGLRVARFDFPYMQQIRATGRRRGPDPQPVLLAALRAAATATGAAPDRLVLAGKSMGGRMSTMVADELQVAGTAALGYPFHPPGKPQQLRTQHLATLRTPGLILQGERDPFGTRDEVEGYALAPTLEVVWLPDGDHSLQPRVRSGHTAAGNRAAATAALVAFARRVCGG